MSDLSNTEIEQLSTSGLDVKKLLEMFEKAIDQVQKGVKIPNLPNEEQRKLSKRLDTYEQTINALFPNAIEEEQKSIAPTVKFVGTAEMFEGVVADKESFKKKMSTKPRDIMEHIRTALEILPAIYKTFDYRGVKVPGNTQRLLVHTTLYRPNEEPRQVTSEEAEASGKHELTHGKVKAGVARLWQKTGEVEVYSGLKKLKYSKGGDETVAHEIIDEAATDLIVALADKINDIGSWDKVLEVILSAPTATEFRRSQAKILIGLMRLTFPEDVKAGFTLIGEAYFSSDPDMFWVHMGSQLARRGMRYGDRDELEKYSENNNMTEMNKLIQRLSASTEQKGAQTQQASKGE